MDSEIEVKIAVENNEDHTEESESVLVEFFFQNKRTGDVIVESLQMQRYSPGLININPQLCKDFERSNDAGYKDLARKMKEKGYTRWPERLTTLKNMN